MKVPVSLIPPLDDSEKLLTWATDLAPRSSGSRGRAADEAGAADEEGASDQEVEHEGLPDRPVVEANNIGKAGDDAESVRDQIALLCKQATQKELRERCRAASLPQYGNKEDLARRLVATGC